MKTRVVAIGAGAGFTSIYATSPCHYMSITQDSNTPTITMEVKRKDDSPTPFGTTILYPAAAVVEIFGPGIQGVVGMPAGWRGNSLPTNGTEVFRVRDSAGAGFNVRVTEIEQLG